MGTTPMKTPAKIVQRLPVKIELLDYDPDRDPLFVGVSVTPYVYHKEPPTGPNAGALLQPFVPPAGVPVSPTSPVAPPPTPTSPNP